MASRAGDFSFVRPVNSVDPARATASATDFQREALKRLSELTIGQNLQGKVLTRFDDGSFLVQLANTAARMQLPGNINVGDALRLQLMSHSPRPTFMLIGDAVPGSTTTSRIITPQQLLPLPTTPTPQNTPGTGTPTTLSNTGQLINSLLPQGGQSPALSPSSPMLAGPALPAAIAGAMRNAIQFSGLFYESHVAEWAAGKRPLTDLHKEPQQQMRLTADQANTILSRPDALQTQLGQIMQMQLQTLDQQQVAWQGFLWPGLFMQWEMSREHGDGQADANGTYEPVWHSVIHLQFEKLGDITAAIKLHGKKISVQVRTDNPAIAQTLNHAAKQLELAMEAAGSPLQSLTVKLDGRRQGQE